MNTENKELMQAARASLSGKWGLPIAVGLVYALLNGGVHYTYNLHGTQVQLPVFALIFGGPMTLGVSIFFLHISRNQEARFEQLFEGFKIFKTAFIAYLLMMIIIFLLTLLFIIPGIIAGLYLSMTFFIIADNRSIDARDALRASKEMMEGHKMKLFRLGLRLLGLALLCILTLGIGFLWFIPYANVTMAKFYDDIKDGEWTGSVSSAVE